MKTTTMLGVGYFIIMAAFTLASMLAWKQAHALFAFEIVVTFTGVILNFLGIQQLLSGGGVEEKLRRNVQARSFVLLVLVCMILFQLTRLIRQM